MARNMFISTHNYWFSRLVLLSSLVVLAGMLIGAYSQLLPIENTTKNWMSSLQSYVMHSTPIIILFLTSAAWYLQRELTMRPLLICIGLLALASSQYFVTSWAKLLDLTDQAILAQTLISLLVLCMFWWIKSMTGPTDNAFISQSDKKFRGWASLGFLFLLIQIAMTTWVIATRADEVCQSVAACSSQFIPTLNFQALKVSPLNQEAMITLYVMTKIITIFTVSYLTLLSFIIIFSRNLGEKGIVLFSLMLAQIALLITEWAWHKSLWLTFSRDIIFVFILLNITSLLIELFKKPSGSYN